MKLLLAAALAGMLLAADACAQSFYMTGRVSEVSPAGDYFKIYRLNTQTQDAEEVRIDIEQSTLFRGLRGTIDLEPGDVVSVSGDYNDFVKEWTAGDVGFAEL